MIIELLELYTMIEQCTPQVHPQTIVSIVETESSRNTLAFNVNDKNIIYEKPQTLDEAKALADEFYSKGINFDVGLMQINSANFEALGVKPHEVLDVCMNLRLGGEILTQNYLEASKKLDDKAALLASLSAYNTGNEKKGFENGYVDKVQKSSEKYIVPSISSEQIEEVQKWNVFLQDDVTFW